jgi:acyl-CoA synthetase (AMP-forming)/AMP-acid ligase II
MRPFLNPAARLVDAASGDVLTGARLRAAWEGVARELDRAPAGVVLCLVEDEVPSVIRYLGAMAAGRPVILWDASCPFGQVEDLVRRVTPAVVAGLPAHATAVPDGYAAAEAGPLGAAWISRRPPEALPDARLSLMLGTSGSTGEPRLVRLAGASVVSGAQAIRAVHGIDERDVAITTMPMFHALGLSVLHIHLLAGATIVIEPHGVLDDAFWASVDRYGVTSLTGVPHLFQVLARKPWSPHLTPSVTTLSVCGDRLPDPLVKRFHESVTALGGRMFVMYGQTEAGSRICVLPPDDLPAKLGSVGLCVPGMRVTLDQPQACAGVGTGLDGTGPDGVGEVVCHARSVMMGYASTARDLARGDDQHGVLRTGDLGEFDDDGYLWLRGRLSRIGKVFGVRVNLDAVEHVAGRLVPAAALADGDRIHLVCEGVDSPRLAKVAAAVADQLGIHRAGIRATRVDRLPRFPTGKINYRAVTG